MNAIQSCLYLGSLEDAGNAPLLERQGIRALLSLEPVRPAACVWVQLQLEMRDRRPLERATLERALDFIHQQVSLERPLLIHCRMGISRSPTLALAYLMRHRQLSLDAALQAVQARRPQADPHPALLDSLAIHQHNHRLEQAA